MGIGMQIAYIGFAGSMPLEAEAGAQLVRIQRYDRLISGCHLSIEALKGTPGQTLYDARIELIMRTNELKPLPSCVSETPVDAVRKAFDVAERGLAAASRTPH